MQAEKATTTTIRPTQAATGKVKAQAASEAAAGGKAGVVLALMALYLIWGSTYLGIRVALEGFPPFLMAAIRFIVAGTGLYIFLRLRGAPNPTGKQWLSSGAVGVLLLVGGNG